jgi:sucrose-6-phosphate hydrolase SacC (GH32 family)
LESPVFKLNKRYLNFLVGGDTDYGTRIELVIDGQVRLYSSGPGSNELVWHNLDVGAWIGRQAFVRAIDELECGHLLIAEIALTDEPIKPVNYKDITLWVDHGRDFYAPITFSNAPEGRHLWLGWMNNWAYAGKVPPRPWRGQMSLPRELDVLETPDGKFLRQSPAREIRSIAQINQTHQFNNISASDLAEFFAKSHFVHNCWHLKFALEVQSLSSEFGIKISWTSESKVLIGFDPFNSVFFVDRFTSNPAFKGQTERHEGKRITSTQILRVEIWVDGNTVEVFGDDGLVVISDLIFPDDNENPLELFFGPENPKLSSLSFTPIERTS